MRDGDQREQPDDVAEHLGDAVAGQRAGERRARAAGVPRVVGGERRERDGDGDHGVGGRPVAGPGPVREGGQRVPQQLDEQVAHHDQHGAGGVAAQHPDGAERPDGQQRGRRPGDQHVAPLRQRGCHGLRGRRDRHQLEDAPAEELQHVQRGGQVGHPRAEQPAQQHHGRRAGLGAGYPGEREHQGAEQRADHDGGQRGGERQLRGSRAARLQHEDGAGEAEQADPEVAPQPELVEQPERLRYRLGERPPDLGAAVTGDGDEGVFSLVSAEPVVAATAASLRRNYPDRFGRSVAQAARARPATLSARSARAPVRIQFRRF